MSNNTSQTLYDFDFGKPEPKKKKAKRNNKALSNIKRNVTKRTKDEITLVLTIKRDSKNEAEKNLFKALDLLSEDNEMLYYVKLALYNYYPDFMSLNNLSDIEKKPKKSRKKKSSDSPKQTIVVDDTSEDDSGDNSDIFDDISGITSSD